VYRRPSRGTGAVMTDQRYENREDEREDGEAARGQTEREEEGKPYGGEDRRPDEEELPEP